MEILKEPVSLQNIVAEAHRQATEAGEDGYVDPLTGLFVFTSGYHLSRGYCCNSSCRHCPFFENQ
ncbi:MAG: hypothetical protein GWP30_07380 [Actinobacteria bacterium]|nr:hypothetical protein [Actinomycetota bacterium]